jgi:hypothetical protein
MKHLSLRDNPAAPARFPRAANSFWMNRCLSSSRGANFRGLIFLVRLDVLLLLIVGFEDH